MFPKIGGFPPKSSILIGFSIINHPFWGTPIFGNTHINKPWTIGPAPRSSYGAVECISCGKGMVTLESGAQSVSESLAFENKAH